MFGLADHRMARTRVACPCLHADGEPTTTPWGALTGRLPFAATTAATALRNRRDGVSEAAQNRTQSKIWSEYRRCGTFENQALTQ